MSDLFAKYEDDFNNIIAKIQKITSSFSTLSREKAESALSNSIELFKEGENIIHQLEVESSVNNDCSLQNKVKQYKIEFQYLQSNFQSLQSNYISKKAENAIILGTDDNSANDAGEIKPYKNEDLISDEQMHKEEDGKGEAVEIQNGFDSNKFDMNKDKGDNNDNMIPDDNDLNIQYEKKNKKVLIISSIFIVVILILLIILLSAFL